MIDQACSMARGLAKRLGEDPDEAEGVALLALVEATRDFNGKGRLEPFALQRVRWRLYDFAREERRHRGATPPPRRRGRPAVDETGNRYGRLVVLRRTVRMGRDRAAAWRCRCDCGAYVTVRGRDLRAGKTTSCGCWRREWCSQVGQGPRG